MRALAFSLALALAAATLVARANADPRTDRQKQGALQERRDPAKDLALQRANVEKLDENARRDRAAGNRVGAWAAEHDAKRARKLMAKDEKLEREGRGKAKTDDDSHGKHGK